MRAVVVIIAFGWWIATAAWSCTCGPAPPAEESLRNADTVFFGRCTSGRLVAADHEVEFTFDVQRVWKGRQDKSSTIVRAEAFPSSCAENFVIGATYIVYCSRTGDKLHVEPCSRTCPFPSLDHAGEDRALDAAIRSK